MTNMRSLPARERLVEELKQKIIARLDEVLPTLLPQAETHGIKLTLNIAPLEKQEFHIELNMKL